MHRLNYRGGAERIETIESPSISQIPRGIVERDGKGRERLATSRHFLGDHGIQTESCNMHVSIGRPPETPTVAGVMNRGNATRFCPMLDSSEPVFFI